MYLPNKYTSIYEKIIARGKQRSLYRPFERHHIIPKSLGGSDASTNLVNLTLREHFICHRLLTKMVSGEMRHKMLSAIWYMSNTKKYIIHSRTYEKLRSDIVAAKQGKPAWNKGIPRTDKEKQLMSERRKLSQTEAWNKGVTHSDEVKQQLSELAKNRTVYVCPHCGKSATGGNYFRWHGDNCKPRYTPTYKKGDKVPPRSEESKRKQSQSRKNNKLTPWNKGIPRTEDEKRLMSERRREGIARRNNQP